MDIPPAKYGKKGDGEEKVWISLTLACIVSVNRSEKVIHSPLASAPLPLLYPKHASPNQSCTRPGSRLGTSPERLPDGDAHRTGQHLHHAPLQLGLLAGDDGAEPLRLPVVGADRHTRRTLPGRLSLQRLRGRVPNPEPTVPAHEQHINAADNHHHYPVVAAHDDYYHYYFEIDLDFVLEAHRHHQHHAAADPAASHDTLPNHHAPDPAGRLSHHPLPRAQLRHPDPAAAAVRVLAAAHAAVCRWVSVRLSWGMYDAHADGEPGL
ncbi:hypothetical protein MCOR03_005226 [Pyricularia oryzae]|nr:hypothetical protein MCOR32_001945 [Pyricularia oryzae]KAI6558668.1 hypothetical protein MCOR03_005226 [Pyricularia oryzae]KAI6588185.1 hypothetical protein MCOR04_004206 [Pyricularia oryzae]